jgi:hypothetical protein
MFTPVFRPSLIAQVRRLVTSRGCRAITGAALGAVPALGILTSGLAAGSLIDEAADKGSASRKILMLAVLAAALAVAVGAGFLAACVAGAWKAGMIPAALLGGTLWAISGRSPVAETVRGSREFYAIIKAGAHSAR